jgi:uncharacterized protein with HEPN domain
MRHKGKDDSIADRIRILHMRDAAKDARRYLAGRIRSDLDSDSMLLHAVVHCLQVIGEAAARVTEQGRLRAPKIPWKKIVGMRHILVHVYYDIDTDTVWRVSQNDLKPLLDEIEIALNAWPDA